jgi:hypothetical protein
VPRVLSNCFTVSYLFLVGLSLVVAGAALWNHCLTGNNFCRWRPFYLR